METHLDCLFANSELAIDGFSAYRKNRNKFGEGVAILIRDNVPVKQRNDLMREDIEVIWIKVYLPHLRPFLVGCCYRSQSSNIQYFVSLCEMLDMVSEDKCELYLLGDINIDWLAGNCALKNRLKTKADTCGLSQLLTIPTRIIVNDAGVTSMTCMDHIYCNKLDFCSSPVSVPVGFSDHNLVAISRGLN